MRFRSRFEGGMFHCRPASYKDLSKKQRAWEQQDAIALQLPYRLLAYKLAQLEKADAALLDNWRWNLLLWSSADREEFCRMMDEAYNKLLESNPQIKEETPRRRMLDAWRETH